MAKKPEIQQPDTMKRIGISIIILILLVVTSSIIAVFFTTGDTETANTAVIRIIGPIAGDNGDVFSDDITTSTSVVKQLERAQETKAVTAIMIEINSPGGTAVASDEIAQAIERTDKPTVAVIREAGASGAYWIASSTDHIVANRMSVTGSIGVIGSYLAFPAFLQEWNITHNRLVAGERKDIGSPMKELSREDRMFLEHKLDLVHGFFLEEVQENRNLSNSTVRDISDGRFMLGIEAEELGLVDELGGKQEALAWLQNQTGVERTTAVYEEKESFFDVLLGAFTSKRLDVENDFVPMAR